MRIFFLAAIITTLVLTISAQQTDVRTLSNTRGGQRVVAYFTAFNSGDEQKLRAFFTENISEASLKQRPVEPRLEFHKQVRNDFQTVEVKRVVSISDSEIDVLAQSVNGGWITYSFKLEMPPGQKIVGMQIEQTDAPPEEKSPSSAPANSAEFITTAGKYLDQLAKADAFSGVVLVAKDDKPIFSKAYGAASKEYNVPNRLDTIFNLGSINKIFTRVAIGQLVQQGKISFDDKLGKYLPDYPNKDAAEKVTIRHLVTMKSGIGDFFGEKFMNAPKDKLRNNSDFIPLFADKPLAFEPGTSNAYSNGGYILLGAIIEKATGKSYYDYVRENIFKPAGMLNTDSYESDKMPVNSASGYTTRGSANGRVNNLFTRPARGSAAGGGYSTAEDLLKFSIALKTGKLTIPDDDGKPRTDGGLGIAGGADGINGLLLVNGQTGFTVIVLSNYDPPSAEKAGGQIRDWLKQLK